MTDGFVPERGDVVRRSFSLQAGREQAGRRPGLMLSPTPSNVRAGLALLCPITSRATGYPFEVGLHGIAGIRGVVLADHLRNLEWRARQAELAGRAPQAVMDEVLAKLRPLVGL